MHQNSSVDKSSPQKNVFFFQINKKILMLLLDMTFQILDGTPLWNYEDPIKKQFRNNSWRDAFVQNVDT